ncbi:helix-turn-helix domain-containing protein [Nocardia rhizosphaerihabitans]|uniref:helix-turn-helix domain-containing protein n=1 Tax=Nocardia rhizosphaerihabitans TaxID=1691570 RepID=UPI00166DA7FD|nr:helix-turn-helix domain-containing protein [Nocardia rhizosphaerihabitans]
MAASSSAPRTTAAKLVLDARRRRGLSQRELARRADVAQSTVATIESGRRQPSVAMLEQLLAAAGFRLDTALANVVRPSELLDRYRAEFHAVLGRYPVANVWLFGSVARGDDRPDSDLDLLIELAPGASLLDILGLDDDLAAVLGCPVDVVTTTEVDSNDLLRRGVKRDRLPLEFAV